MTVSTTDWKKQYDGNGVTTAFPFPYPFLENSHITVIETVIATGVETTLALTTDYTITGAGNPAGGTITAVTAPASTKRWTILRIVPETQAADYNEGDAFPAAVNEQALDKLTMLVQQNARRIALSMRLADTDATGASVILPTPVALEILRWNAAGTAIETFAAGSVDLAIPADDSVTLAKMAEMATNKLIGRSTAGTGNPEYIDLTAAGRALLDDASADAQLTTLGGTVAGKAVFTAASYAAIRTLLGIGDAVPISETSITASASMDFATAFSANSTYPYFQVVIESADISNNVLWLRLSEDGATFKSGATDYEWIYHKYDHLGGAISTTVDATDSKIILDIAISSSKRDVAINFVGVHDALVTSAAFKSSSRDASQSDVINGVGNQASGAIVTGFQILPSSGNFVATGKIRIYGSFRPF